MMPSVGRGWALSWGVLSLLCLAERAQADTWVVQDEDSAAVQRWRLSFHTELWFGTFERANSICPPFFGFCPADRSSEIAFGPTAEVGFHVVGPAYLTLGLEAVYTKANDGLPNQFIVGVPFGLLLTWAPWKLRPFAQFRLRPLLMISDGRRDFTLGGQLGLAYEIGDFPALVFAVGHHRAAKAKIWAITLGIQPEL